MWKPSFTRRTPRRRSRLTVETLEGRDVPSYGVIDLGVTAGFVSSGATAINNSGEVVGSESTTTGVTADTINHAFLWQNGTMTDLGTLGGPNSYALGINFSGQVVGVSDIAETNQYGDHPRHAFLWQTGTMTDLGTLGGSTSQASGINDAGQVVGTAATVGDVTQHAFLWQNGVMTDLGTLPGGTVSSATAINNAGQVVGTTDDNYPFLWQAGTMTALDLGWGDSAYASAINDAGQVVGSFTGGTFFGSYTSAALWENGVLTEIGWDESWANDINNLGQIVGWSVDPYLWQNGTATNLRYLLPAGTGPVYVQAINDAGQIVGSAGDHAVLLDQVPDLSISSVSLTEGNSGTTSAAFTVTLLGSSSSSVTVQFATADDTATASLDYQPTTGTLTFAPGETTKTITVPVIGDRLAEPNETFFVNLSGSTNANIASGQGVGTILDDEPRISITDVTKAEGNRHQTTLFTFTVSLSAAYDQPVTVSFQTTNGTATTGDHDYVAQTGTLTFAPGETIKTVTIVVNGDNKPEANETFYVDLSGLSSNAMFTRSRGVGTILNDD